MRTLYYSIVLLLYLSQIYISCSLSICKYCILICICLKLIIIYAATFVDFFCFCWLESWIRSFLNDTDWYPKIVYCVFVIFIFSVNWITSQRENGQSLAFELEAWSYKRVKEPIWNSVYYAWNEICNAYLFPHSNMWLSTL